MKEYPMINMKETGRNIANMRKERGITIREISDYMGFREPVAIYKWQRGDTLPSVDNLFALSRLFEVPIDAILKSK